MGCCFGGLANFRSKPARSSKTLPKRKTRQGSTSNRWKRQWSSSPDTMENKDSNSLSVETQLSLGPSTVNKEMAEENVNSCPFFNHALIAWHEQRKEWVGGRSKKSTKVQREPVIRPGSQCHDSDTNDLSDVYDAWSWSTTYDDLLSTNQPFPRRIPLGEMVDFLVDIWHEEGLYD